MTDSQTTQPPTREQVALTQIKASAETVGRLLADAAQREGQINRAGLDGNPDNLNYAGAGSPESRG